MSTLKMFKEKHKTELQRFIDFALYEDIAQGDISGASCLDRSQEREATIVLKEPCVIAGVSLAEAIFKTYDTALEMEMYSSDGDLLNPGDKVFTIRGKAQSILATERLVLNCMQRMSGIATLTYGLNQKIKHTSCRLLDTRKTTPGFRYPEKWAVQIGGGVNHRMGLFDAIMIKDNHIDYCGSIAATLTKTKAYLIEKKLEVPVIVEARDLNEISQVIKHPWVSRILLDNMTPEEIRSAILLIEGRFMTEASGNITAENLVAYSETGVDFVSMGALTHSAANIDMSLKAL